jgi:hypothetical protein
MFNKITSRSKNKCKKNFNLLKAASVICLFLLAGCSGSDSALKTMTGTWYGNGNQLDNGTTWSIKVNLSDKEQSIEYPSLKCGGTLTLIDEAEKKLTFQETITFGIGRCTNKGYVELTLNTDELLDFKYYSPTNTEYNKGELNAKGVLTREQ